MTLLFAVSLIALIAMTLFALNMQMQLKEANVTIASLEADNEAIQSISQKESFVEEVAPFVLQDVGVGHILGDKIHVQLGSPAQIKEAKAKGEPITLYVKLS